MTKKLFAILLLSAALASGFFAGRASARQDHMLSARGHLRQAKEQLQEAVADKGGHREKAIGLCDDAIAEVDAASDNYPAYFMINCAHPDHFAEVLEDAAWTRRIRGVRANASRRSHAELDEAPELDAGDPREFARQYRELVDRLPWLNVFGGCCGSDLRHVTEIARALCCGSEAGGATA